MGKNSKTGLPYGIDEVTVIKTPTGKTGKLFAVVKPAANGSFDAKVVDTKGEVYVSFRG